MILGIGREADVFLYAALSGLSVWAAYGILICFRKIVSHRRIMISLEDIVFWIGASVYIRDSALVFCPGRPVRGRSRSTDISSGRKNPGKG